MNKPGIDALKENIRIAVDKIIDQILSEFPKDQICAFALYSDSDARTLAPSFNLKAHLNSMQAEDPDDKAYYKWSPAEWSHEFYRADFFDEVSKELEKLSESVGEGESFERYRKEVFESCVTILKEFKHRFNDSIFVFAVTDFDDISLETSWIRSLNPTSEAVEFEEWRATV
ncbi:hypothetical protein ALO70_200151 [Pseudomonas amygdali pv. eriobotryae]|uniref:DUF4303 domain-containing protein n=1 Tax=Pseudomonas amygdali pv. eriobotryae TaxID=129137 RepID=A0A0P9QAI1_PSEA0|nr:DUF4303 domain-containing protein [Pseudomonas amygdali]KPX30546.1 hypothetical protein ALO70_200151 [Pseudomonas amygdali pv. eriobotryae]KWS79971.1 hypothetical protein AL052_01085 [Pseudomonas amygdali pv. eriobotryae]RML96473.1 hypothetical protein ALQ86_200154 [Pseudomonas amygdali pv. eriobotryae]RMO64869.1 hypothetical protein ALQ39_03370 [Pseudomonas amygdali pv. eriobotryae]